MDWENIGPGEWRTPVPGGWLVKIEYEVQHMGKAIEERFSSCMVSGYDWRPALAYVPDPNHEWKTER